MKKLFLMLAVLCSVAGWSQNTAFFDAGNEAYSNGKYEEAVKNYSQILENGETSAALHYNLGNAYYKLNRIAPSIYHYEKALKLDPADADIRNNLEFARNRTIDAIAEEEPEGFSAIFTKSTSAFNAEGWGWLAVACMLIFVVLFLGYYFSRKASQKRMVFIFSLIFLFFAIASAGIGYFKKNMLTENNFAIIFAEEVAVKNEPSVRGEDVFSLHEGAKVKITEDFQGWVKFELPNGNQGWIEETEIKRI